MSRPQPFIVLVGNMGAGKTTFAEALGQRLSIPVYPEPYQDNPYLERAYQDPVRWRAECGRWFLESSAAIHRQAAETGGIQDRGIYENYEVFTFDHRARGWISEEAMQDLSGYAAELYTILPPVDLTVYLRNSPAVTLARVTGRGRAMEKEVDLAMISSLHDGLETMMDDWPFSPRLVLDTFPLSELDQQLDLVAHALANPKAFSQAD